MIRLNIVGEKFPLVTYKEVVETLDELI